MPGKPPSELKFAIGHVLFIDIVGYSKLLINEQSEQLETLKKIVRGTEQFGLAEAKGKLLRLPTGDGGALVFRTSPEAPVRCAIEIGKELKRHPELHVRMGIHSGPVNEVVDFNEEANIAGAGINMAQRVMDCGDAGHILLSQRVAEDLAQYRQWQPVLHDLGEAEVKHGARVHVFNLYTKELGNPEVPQKFQQAQRAKAGRNNLPAELSSFIGREEQIAEIKQLLAHTRLMTLTGAGGCGKTRLALRLAAGLLSQYSDGVWLVELAPASQPDMIAQLAAEALRIREQPKRALMDTVIESLRSKRFLLVLDNCEHLLEGCAKFAAALLKSCSRSQILATSREPLGIAGERLWQVPSLQTPEPTRRISLEQLSEFEAVRLFQERAIAVQPQFALSQENASAVAQICWRLEGMPLALELAAARMSALSAALIAQRLQHSLQLLSRGKRTGLPHHQTLEATIAWSYALLTESEQMLFQGLSVFAGGFDLKAAERVCSVKGIEGDEILDLLTSLAEKSLVVVHTGAGLMRYRLLEPIRQYAQERLHESGAMLLMQRRHADYFLHLAEQAESRMLGPEQLSTSEELELEHANLLTALGWTAENESEIALKLSNALGWFWEFRGYLAQGREWFKRTAAQSPIAREELRGEAYVRAGRLACWQGEYEDAVALTEEGLRLCERSGNRRWEGMALNNLGGVAAYRGELDQAGTLLEQGLSIAKELDDKDLIWRSLQDLGVVARYRGDYERARNLIEQGFSQLRDKYGPDLDRPHEARRIDRQLRGEIESALGNSEKAASYYEEALAIAQKLGNKRAAVGALDGLGRAAFDRGDYAAARAFYEQAFQVAEELGQKSDYAITLAIHMAELAAEEREFDQARILSTTSLRNSHDAGDKESIAAGLSVMAWLRFASFGQAEAAAQLFGAVEAIRESLGIRLGPHERARHECRIAAVRAALDRDTFGLAWARGRTMTINEAVALARAN